jgi:hypothetical protein
MQGEFHGKKRRWAATYSVEITDRVACWPTGGIIPYSAAVAEFDLASVVQSRYYTQVRCPQGHPAFPKPLIYLRSI